MSRDGGGQLRGVKVLRRWRSLLFGIVLGVIAYSLIQTQVGFFPIEGISMEPTLKSGDRLLLNKQSKVEREQLVVFAIPPSWKAAVRVSDDVRLVKRIVAVPGDEVVFDGRLFTVNGEPRWNTGAYARPCYAAPFRTQVPPDKIFVTGDNMQESVDSRYFLCNGSGNHWVPIDSIVAHGTLIRKL